MSATGTLTPTSPLAIGDAVPPPCLTLLDGRRVVPSTAVLDRAGRLPAAIPGALSDDDAMGLAKWAGAA